MSRNNSVNLPKTKKKLEEISDYENSSDSECFEAFSEAENSGSEVESEKSKKTAGKKETKGSKKGPSPLKGQIRSRHKAEKNPKAPNNKRKKMEYDDFDDTDISIDMSTEFVKPKKIKLSNNLIVCRKMISVEEGGKKWTYPGLVFLRKMKDSKAFEFNLPLKISDLLIDAIRILNVRDEPPSSKHRE